MRYPACRLLLAMTVSSLLLSPAVRAADGAPQPEKKILFFSKSAGFEHSVIKDPPRNPARKPGGDIPGLAFRVLSELGRARQIDFVFSKDGSLFTPAYLAQFDAYIFYTTGDLTTVGTDGNPAMSAAGKAALLQAIAGGKGFIGLHSATDTFHSPGNKEHGPARFQSDGDQADDYIKMIGGEFIQHGKQQPSHLIVADPQFPGAAAVPADLHLTEEWYSLKDFAPDLHVILVQGTAGMTGIEYARPNYPSTWARMHGKGRVFYTNLGHRDDVWESPMFQAVVMGGVDWALGRVDADLTPNLDQAAPEANVLPKYVVPPPKAH
jgi:type 1 glutamine amidotransferase